MQNSAIIKKIDKLKKKIGEIDERIKHDTQLKQDYSKEIESLEAESIIIACKSSNITLKEAVDSFQVYNLFKSSGMNTDEIKELLASSTTSSGAATTDMDTVPEEDKND